MAKVAPPAGAETSRALVVIIVIILGLLGYSLYQNNSLQNQVNTLQKENNDLEVNLQALGLRFSELIALITTTTGAPTYKFEVTSVCISVGPGCPAGGTVGGTGYVYAIGVKNIGAATILASSGVFLYFNDTTVQSSFGFNSTLPSNIAPNSIAYVQGAAWPAITNATSKLSPGDSIAVSITIGSAQGGIDTAVLPCTSSTTTEVNGTSTTTQIFSCG